MRKVYFVLFSSLFLFCAVFPAWSYMPSYPDDDEFKACTEVSSWDDCAKDEFHRALRTVKQQYRAVLTTPSILQWHSSADENVEILRDMYDSWTAFRTRLCSLSSKAVEYVEPLVDEKTACNLYYTLHHRDHFDSILLLMTKRAPNRQQDFGFLKIFDHDEEYAECIKGNQTNCIEQEFKRSGKAIKDYYKTFLNDEYVGKWNNAPDLKKGNYRDMYDSWIAYRNRMCSLAVWAYQSFYGPNSMNLTTCLQFYNREKLETMANLLVVAHSTLDEGYDSEDDSSEDSSDYEPPEDDGGLAEGRTIMPLERNIGSGILNPDDDLVQEEPQTDKKDEPEDKHDIPAWAQ